MGVATPWPNSRIASILQAVGREPHIDRVVDGERYREWTWNGAIYTATPRRAALCAACGNKIAGGTRAIYVVHSEGPNGPWAPEKRYLHAECVGVKL